MSESTPEVTLESFDELTQQLIGRLFEYSAKFVKAQAVGEFNETGREALLDAARKTHPKYGMVLDLLAEIDREIEISEPTTEEIEAAKVTMKSLSDSAASGIAFLRTIHGDDDAFLALVPAQFKKVSGVKRTAKAASGEPGSKKPRLSAAKVTILNGNGTSKVLQEWSAGTNPTFGNIAETINSYAKGNGGGMVTVNALQKGAFGIAGTDDLTTKKGIEFEYAVSVEGKENGQSHTTQFTVSVTPR